MRTNEYLELLNKAQDNIDPKDWQRYIDQLSEIERAKVLRDAEIERKRNEMKDYNPLAWSNSPAQFARAKMAGYMDDKTRQDWQHQEWLPHDDIEGVTVEEFNQREPSNERNKDLYDALVNKDATSKSERELLDNEIEELEAQLYSMKNQPGYRAARFDYTVKGDRSGLDKIAQNVISSYENALNRKNQKEIASKTKQGATARDVAGLVKQYNDLVIQRSSLTDDQSKRMNDNAKDYILTQLRSTPEGNVVADQLIAKVAEQPPKTNGNGQNDIKVLDDKEIEHRLNIQVDKNTSPDKLEEYYSALKEVNNMAIDTSTRASEDKTLRYRNESSKLMKLIEKLQEDQKKGAAAKVQEDKEIEELIKQGTAEIQGITNDLARNRKLEEYNQKLIKLGKDKKYKIILSVDGSEMIPQRK